MEIGLGIDGQFALGADDQRALAREASALGYRSLWTPSASTREPFDLCALWQEASGLPTGIAVAPLSGWSIEDLAAVARDTFRRCDGRFTLGVGSGRATAAPIRLMRDAIAALRTRLPEREVYLGAIGPQMLRLAGERYDGAALNWCSPAQVAWSPVRADLESRRAQGAGEDELARRFPDELLRLVGYWGRPAGARDAFRKLASGLDIAVVRLVPARRNDAVAVRFAMSACAPERG